MLKISKNVPLLCFIHNYLFDKKNSVLNLYYDVLSPRLFFFKKLCHHLHNKSISFDSVYLLILIKIN